MTSVYSPAFNVLEKIERLELSGRAAADQESQAAGSFRLVLGA